MAKSTGDRVLVDGLLRDYPPAAIRLLCLNRAWAGGWSYSIDDLEAAAAPLQDLYAAAAMPGQAGAALVPSALLNDLDVPTVGPSAWAAAHGDGYSSSLSMTIRPARSR